jgi:hypothetical protein
MSYNYVRLQDRILLFKIPMGMRKNFFEIYREFEHVPSKRFARPGLEGLRKLTKPRPG